MKQSAGTKQIENSQGKYLCLRGEHEDTVLCFPLRDGRHIVGSAQPSDILLTISGVSRRHAILKVEGDSITVEDKSSTNGTFINGKRIDLHAAKFGDILAFGSVKFSIGRVDRDDTELAISLAEHHQDTSGNREETQKDDTGRSLANDKAANWIELINELSSVLLGPGDPNVAEALNLVGKNISAESVHLLSYSGGEHAVLNSWGAVDNLDVSDDMKSAFKLADEAGRLEPTMLTGKSDGNPPHIWIVGSGINDDPLGLVIVGEFEDRKQCNVPLETILRMIMYSRSEPVRVEIAPQGKSVSRTLAFPPGYVQGSSKAMLDVYKQMEQVLTGDIPVLITGETGVGKEFIALILHASSDRAGGPFVALNCAAIPAELLEAELFGIEGGVATGVTKRPGKFQLAEGGILFLDEIGDMGPGLQAKLLRVLQEHEVLPVGARSPVPVNVRIISSTNLDLESRIASNKFRRDLYFRIAGFPLHIPPLRERREDIPHLVEHFMKLYSEERSKNVQGMTVKAYKAICSAPWPGNIRELGHEIRRLVYTCSENGAIDSTCLPNRILFPTYKQSTDSLKNASSLNLEKHTTEVERRLITIALSRSKGNRSKAAKLLGISRNGLANKMKNHGLEKGK